MNCCERYSSTRTHQRSAISGLRYWERRTSRVRERSRVTWLGSLLSRVHMISWTSCCMLMERKEAHCIRTCLTLMSELSKSSSERTVLEKVLEIGNTRTTPQCSWRWWLTRTLEVGSNNWLEVLRVLSKYGANFKVKDFDGNNLAHLALKHRSPEALYFLVN